MSRGGFSRGGNTRGRGSFGGRGAGRGGFQQRDFGPPDTVLEMGSFVHAVEDEMLCSSLMADKVPYFNAPIYLQNKSVIGKMGEGMVASSFKKGDKVYIGGDKLLPIERFLPKPKVTGVQKRARGARGGAGGPGRGRGFAAGGRGGFQRGGGRGRGSSRGAPSRGSFGGDRGGRGMSRGFSSGRGAPRGRGYS